MADSASTLVSDISLPRHPPPQNVSSNIAAVNEHVIAAILGYRPKNTTTVCVSVSLLAKKEALNTLLTNEINSQYVLDCQAS